MVGGVKLNADAGLVAWTAPARVARPASGPDGWALPGLWFGAVNADSRRGHAGGAPHLCFTWPRETPMFGGTTLDRPRPLAEPDAPWWLPCDDPLALPAARDEDEDEADEEEDEGEDEDEDEEFEDEDFDDDEDFE